jgi:hypothetical protein
MQWAQTVAETWGVFTTEGIEDTEKRKWRVMSGEWRVARKKGSRSLALHGMTNLG